MLGRLFANHKRLDITVRELAASFGGSRMTYQRASKTMQEHLRDMEEIAFKWLAEYFVKHGVSRE